MKDEAVSPVIAFMLLLMIVVSFISLLNGYYIPSLKQQAEIEHLGQVQQSFLTISADIDRLLSFSQNGIVKERCQLGGGDVIFSPLRSSGTLKIADEGWIASLIVNDTSGDVRVFTSSMISIVYRPTGNYWVNQGYSWNCGLVNLTKGTRTTCAEYSSGEDAIRARNSFICFISTPISEESSSTTDPLSLADTRITFRGMGYDPGHSFVSSNGFAGIDLNLTVDQVTIPNASSIQFEINASHPLYEQIKINFNDWIDEHFSYNNCIKNPDPISGIITVTFNTNPVKVIVNNNTLSARIT